MKLEAAIHIALGKSERLEFVLNNICFEDIMRIHIVKSRLQLRVKSHTRESVKSINKPIERVDVIFLAKLFSPNIFVAKKCIKPTPDG